MAQPGTRVLINGPPGMIEGCGRGRLLLAYG